MNREEIAEELRSPRIQKYAVHCDNCGAELYHSRKRKPASVDVAASLIITEIHSHMDKEGHEWFTLDIDEEEAKEIEPIITIDK